MAKVPNAVEKIAENYNRLSRVHERYRQTDRRQTDGRQQLANVNVSSRWLKIILYVDLYLYSVHAGRFVSPAVINLQTLCRIV